MTTTPIPYTMTQDSITVILDGKPFTTQVGTPQYHGLRDCIFREDWGSVHKHTSTTSALQQWLGDKFVVTGVEGTISYEGAALPSSLVKRIWAMATAGESPGPLFAFYERLSRNPSKRSVDQLFDFMLHANIPIEPDGTLLTYKGVRSDLRDVHSETFDNSPGNTHKMPRNQVSDDPNHACHAGFHVGDLSYARNFSSRVVICRVDPEHVVSVPKDEQWRKMRVCEYTIVGLYGDQPMPSTTFVPDTAPTGMTDDNWGGDVEDLDDEIDDDADKDTANDVEPEHADGRAGADLIATSSATTLTSKPAGPKAATFARMSPTKLIEQGIDDLRKYASAHLKIVGASKLPGGKSALVAAILKARKRRSR